MDVTEVLVNNLSEAFNQLGADVTIIFVRNDALCIVLMLNFHASESADVNVAAEVPASSESLRDTHVHIEGFVGFILTVGDASFLLSGLSKFEFIIEAELVALSEQELREGGLLQ